jgi:hypothetical protein
VAISWKSSGAPVLTLPRVEADPFVERSRSLREALAESPWPLRLGACLLVLGSAWPAPLGTISGLTITGDRVFGLVALAGLGVLAVGGRLRWTRVHTALAAFVAVQVLATAINARTWSQGPKFVTIYVLGFACFALTAECARGPDGRRWLVGAWIGLGAVLSVLGTLTAGLANLYQRPFWGTGGVQPLYPSTEYERILFGARVTFNEWNLFSSFLLIPFALALWSWRRDAAPRWRLVAALVAIFFGLVHGLTRAAWVSMIAIVAFWWRARRARSWQVVALVAMLAVAGVVQAGSIGATPIWARLFEHNSNLLHRMIINRVTVESWLELPVSVPEARYFGPEQAAPDAPGLLGAAQNIFLGHGAGSVNRLSIVFPDVGRVDRIWNGNVVLFMLHDSGVLGLAALLGVVGVIAWRARRAMARGVDPEASALIVPLLASGAALCFAYQFTHGLWLMYPYVYLGLLTAVVESAAEDRGGGTTGP